MALGGGGKRKRGDGREDGSRPSPHRPSSLSLGQQGFAQQSQQQHSYNRDQYEQRSGGRRRASRGGRGGGSQRSPLNSPDGALQSRSTNGPTKTMSPPVGSGQPISEYSQTTHVQPTSTTNTSKEQASSSQSAFSLRYVYEYITDNRIDQWADSGRKTVLDIGLHARRAEDTVTLGLLFQELIKSCLDKRIDGAEAGSLIQKVLEDQPAANEIIAASIEHNHSRISSLFLDNLSIVTENIGTASSALQKLVSATGISPLLMRHELDSTLLENLGMIRNTFVRVGIRQQTNLLYRQSNYNLLREETEGYSKLITELFTTSSSEPLTSEVVEETLEHVKGMIGAFDLDVGRVLDITLDVFAAVLVKQYRFFVKYLRASSWWPQQKATNNGPANLALSALPKWALPGSSGRPISDEERSEIARARDERDKVFWERVKTRGIVAFFEINGQRVEGSKLKVASFEGRISDNADVDEDRKWIEATGTLPPTGNKIAAQILGFKLRFYSSTARDPTDIFPVNLLYLAALLIKIGFISLRDLYPHLWPTDEAMDNSKEGKLKEKAEREKLNRPGGGTMNALMAAGALPDDTVVGGSRPREMDKPRDSEVNRNSQLDVRSSTARTSPAPQLDDDEALPEPADQKVQLLKSLLCIGALPESLYMLGRFPWLSDAFPDLPEHIHRIVHHCLSKVYEPLRPLQEREGLQKQQKIADLDQSGVIKGQVRLLDPPARRVLRWAQIDKDDTNDATDYKFYWDDWADNIPVCQSIDDVFLLCSTLLNFTSVKIGQDSALLVKLSRIGCHSLTSDPSESNISRWVDLSKRLIVPSLSLTKCNPGVVNEVFELIKNFSTTIRFSIYAEWYSGPTSRLPDMRAAFEQAKAETKDVMKRISKTSVKPMARALAKVAYASPGIVFSVAIAQIESYDNLVETVVECARYFTYLGYDVLTWSLMSSLGGRGRTRVQADGMLTSRWLSALSLFAGKVFKRYSVMSPTPILQYVAEQLRRNNSTDLIVLEEITTSMAGIVSDTNFNEAQVVSMAGGDLLQSQIMLQLLDRRHESRTTAKRLIKALTEPKLAGQILISIAQERQTCIYRIPEPDAHLKLLGNLFDETHRVLAQYLDLLRSNLSIAEFDALVPNVARLINEFGIDPSVAFWISRPSIAAGMAEFDAKALQGSSDSMKTPTKGMTNGDVTLNPEHKHPDTLDLSLATEPVLITEHAEPTSSSVVVKDKESLDRELGGIMGMAANPSISPIKTGSENQPWHPTLQGIMDAIKPALAEDKWHVLGQHFYVTFWQLDLSDIHVPTNSYDDEINRQKKKILAINNDRTDISIAGTQKKDREKKSLADLQDRLRLELKNQVQAYSQTRARLQKEKDHWFSGLWGKWDALNIALIEQCFFPRALLSPLDALYTYKFLRYLHSSGATNFRTMGVFDQLFREKRLTSMLFLCTAKEAENFGRFLNEVLQELSRWHADKAIFEKEAFGTKKDLPGFSRKLTNEKTILTFYDYEEFRRVLLKWHRNLNSAIKACISSGEYMHIRNAINLLKAICQYFPAVNWMGQSQVSSITEISKSESREDLKIAATSLLGNLKRREKDWVLPQAFNLVSTEEAQGQGSTPHILKNDSGAGAISGIRSGPVKPGTPRSDVETPNALNPNATEFKSSIRSTINENVKPTRSASGKLEVEDGEIEDAKLSLVAAKEKFVVTVPPHSETTPLEVLEPVPETSIKEQSIAPNRGSSDLNDSHVLPKLEMAPTMTTTMTSVAQESSMKPPTTNTTNSPAAPPRFDLDRGPPPTSSDSRIQHNLPNRPDPPNLRAVDHRLPPKHLERGNQDSFRESGFLERSKVDRPGESQRDRIPDHSVPSSYTRGNELHSGRSHISDRNRADPSWGDGKPSFSRSNLDDRHGGPRTLRDERLERPPRDRIFSEPQHRQIRTDFQAQSPRNPNMPPPRSGVLQNTDRAAMIHESQDLSLSLPSHHSDRRPESSRHSSYTNNERGSRGGSPTRFDEQRALRHENQREDRIHNEMWRGSDTAIRSHVLRHEDSHVSSGLRTDRPIVGNSSGANERVREPTRILSGTMPTSDSTHGHLGQDSRSYFRREESQYGRLTTASDIPSGPRLPNGNQAPPQSRGSRNIGAPQLQASYQQPENSSANLLPPLHIPDIHPSGGTSSSIRGASRTSASFSRSDPTASVSVTPANESPDTAGVHPDRLKAMQGQDVSSLAPPQNQPNMARTMQHPPSSISDPAPAGPRNPGSQLPSPAGPSPNNRGPPTGPSYSTDRNRGDKRFAGLQNVLQQGNTPNGLDRSSQGASIRGRGSRGNGANVASPSVSGPPTPSATRTDPYSSRSDLFAGRSGGLTASQEIEDIDSYVPGGRRGGGREPPRDSDRRLERHENHRSDSREKAPRHQMPYPEEDIPPRREDPREHGRRLPHDRDTRRPLREDLHHERRMDFDRRDLPEWTNDMRNGPIRDDRDRRDGGIGIRKRGRMGEDGPTERAYAEHKRPRRFN